MWLIAGLGNPGEKYERTYHNLGFLVMDRLAVRNGIRITRPEANSIVGQGTVSGATVLLAKPQTFMNLSGGAVKALLAKYELAPANLVVVYDELALPWTGVRVRPKGRDAGHHGLESVIKSVGTTDFARVRLGIHPGRPIKDGAQYVLSPIGKAMTEELDEMLDHAAGAVESLIAEGAEMSMTKFNRRARGLNKEEE